MSPTETRSPAAPPFFSIVVPVFNEEGNIVELHRRLVATLEGLGRSFEIVFVDDGSRDGSFAAIERLFRADPRVRAVRFSRNFGHHLAITAGLDAARGQAVVLMDSDLEDRPEVIPDLFAKLEEGYDVVYGVRKGRTHSRFKKVTSKLFVALINRIADGEQQLNTSILRIARRPVVDAVAACREQHRFILGLFSWVGFSQIGIDVEHGQRFAGTTKYSLYKMFRLALTTITASSTLPLKAASFLGTLVSSLAFAYAALLLLKKLLWDTMVEGWTSTMVAALFLGGAQLICLGVLGEYVGRIYGEIQRRPLYVVASRLDARLEPHSSTKEARE
jgi:polyisoprenyl-phosphate glycosyltransferase